MWTLDRLIQLLNFYYLWNTCLWIRLLSIIVLTLYGPLKMLGAELVNMGMGSGLKELRKMLNVRELILEENVLNAPLHVL